MKVLRYQNILWDVSTPEQMDAAFKKLFFHLKDDWRAYDSIEDELNHYENKLKELKELKSQIPSIKSNTILGITQKVLEEMSNVEYMYKYYKQQKDLLEKATTGDSCAIKKFMLLRKSSEYENWKIIEVENPLDD